MESELRSHSGEIAGSWRSKRKATPRDDSPNLEASSKSVTATSQHQQPTPKPASLSSQIVILQRPPTVAPWANLSPSQRSSSNSSSSAYPSLIRGPISLASLHDERGHLSESRIIVAAAQSVGSLAGVTPSSSSATQIASSKAKKEDEWIQVKSASFSSSNKKQQKADKSAKSAKEKDKESKPKSSESVSSKSASSSSTSSKQPSSSSSFPSSKKSVLEFDSGLSWNDLFPSLSNSVQTKAPVWPRTSTSITPTSASTSATTQASKTDSSQLKASASSKAGKLIGNKSSSTSTASKPGSTPKPMAVAVPDKKTASSGMSILPASVLNMTLKPATSSKKLLSSSSSSTSTMAHKAVSQTMNLLAAKQMLANPNKLTASIPLIGKRHSGKHSEAAMVRRGQLAALPSSSSSSSSSSSASSSSSSSTPQSSQPPAQSLPQQRRKVRLTPMKRLILRARKQALMQSLLSAMVTRAVWLSEHQQSQEQSQPKAEPSQQEQILGSSEPVDNQIDSNQKQALDQKESATKSSSSSSAVKQPFRLFSLAPPRKQVQLQRKLVEKQLFSCFRSPQELEQQRQPAPSESQLPSQSVHSGSSSSTLAPSQPARSFNFNPNAYEFKPSFHDASSSVSSSTSSTLMSSSSTSTSSSWSYNLSAPTFVPSVNSAPLPPISHSNSCSGSSSSSSSISSRSLPIQNIPELVPSSAHYHPISNVGSTRNEYHQHLIQSKQHLKQPQQQQQQQQNQTKAPSQSSTSEPQPQSNQQQSSSSTNKLPRAAMASIRTWYSQASQHMMDSVELDPLQLRFARARIEGDHSSNSSSGSNKKGASSSSTSNSRSASPSVSSSSSAFASSTMRSASPSVHSAPSATATLASSPFPPAALSSEERAAWIAEQLKLLDAEIAKRQKLQQKRRKQKRKQRASLKSEKLAAKGVANSSSKSSDASKEKNSKDSKDGKQGSDDSDDDVDPGDDDDDGFDDPASAAAAADQAKRRSLLLQLQKEQAQMDLERALAQSRAIRPLTTAQMTVAQRLEAARQQQRLVTHPERVTLGQFLMPGINHMAIELLQQLAQFQHRAKEKDPLNAKSKKRLLCGLREVLKNVRSRKMRALLVAPNIERVEQDGGLDELLQEVLVEAVAHHVPIVFALNRRKLGQAVDKKSARVSVVGVVDDSGAHETMEKIVLQAQSASEQWAMFKNDPFRKLYDFIPVSPVPQQI